MRGGLDTISIEMSFKMEVNGFGAEMTHRFRCAERRVERMLAKSFRVGDRWRAQFRRAVQLRHAFGGNASSIVTATSSRRIM